MAEYRQWPDELIPATNTMILTQPSWGFTSMFTGVQQNVIHPGAYWTIEMTFPDLEGRKKRIMSAFVNGMQGRVETIKVFDHSREGRPAMGNPTVSGDGQYGRVLMTGGWLKGQRVLQIGDYITVNNELKEISQDIWADDEGFAILKFNPPLRKQPANGEKIETERPYLLATMQSDGIKVTNSPCDFGSFETIVLKEAIYK